MTDSKARLLGIYHAKGHLLGKVAYLTTKVLGANSCALCNLTHSFIREKRVVANWRAQLPIKFDCVHLDELSPQLAEFVAGETPCVLHQSAQQVRWFLTKEELEDIAGDVPLFFTFVENRLAEE